MLRLEQLELLQLGWKVWWSSFGNDDKEEDDEKEEEDGDDKTNVHL